MCGVKGKKGVGTAMVKLGGNGRSVKAGYRRGRKGTSVTRVFAQERCWFGSDSGTASGAHVISF